MKIYIAYDSIWHNSFLTGDDDKQIDRNNERKFKASSKSGVVDKKEISTNTVLGVLCRLIGDQRKLYKAKLEDDYYFKDIEHLIDFSHLKRFEYSEIAFIVNKSEKRPAQSSFIGVLDNDVSLFFSDYSQNLWSILELDFKSLLYYIIAPTPELKPLGHASPKKILSQLDLITAMDPYFSMDVRLERLKSKLSIENEKNQVKITSGKELTENEFAKLDRIRQDIDLLADEENLVFDALIKECCGVLSSKFQDKPYISEGRLYPMSLYAAGLYLKLEQIEKSSIPIESFVNKNMNIQGFNPYGFNGVRDFLNPLTGNPKRSGGTPTLITKSSGVLEIKLDIPDAKANELEQLIENAGVSSFYLGKKGLAYVSDIRT